MDKTKLVDADNEPVKIIPLRPTILLVDDESVNLDLLNDIFEDDYNLPVAHDGESAWRLVQEYSDLFDAVLLDRMMPGILGDEVLGRMKKDNSLKQIPVVFQSAKSSIADIRTGLLLGADFYITKPYDRKRLISSVAAAVEKHRTIKHLSDNLEETKKLLTTLALINEGRINLFFRTVDEANRLALLLANIHPDPMRIIPGLLDLLVNAVEHGIVQISYDEKTELNNKGTWTKEVNRRLNLPEHQDKKAKIRVDVLLNEAGEKSIQFQIEDPGEGFDHEKYRAVSEERMFDNHGKGIAMTVMIFDKLVFNGKGNVVTAFINCNQD